MSNKEQQPVYDLLGIGFGPSNLSVAVAVADSWSSSINGTNASPLKNVAFLERDVQFSWHPGMLLPGARMQISFLKDLATLRDPKSPFTFVNYLHAHDRLASFINRGSWAPTRYEYTDYLRWAAEGVERAGVEVAYGQEVIAVEVVREGEEEEADVGMVRVVSVTRDGERHERLARNLVISQGGRPSIPPLFLRSVPLLPPTVLHTSRFVPTLPSLLSLSPAPLRIAVLGAGQSAAETFLSLSTAPEFEKAGTKVDMIIRHGTLAPSDSSSFSNTVFDPEMTDFVYGLKGEDQRRLVKDEWGGKTNYGVVNPVTLEAIFEMLYDQQVHLDVDSRRKSLTSGNGIDSRSPSRSRSCSPTNPKSTNPSDTTSTADPRIRIRNFSNLVSVSYSPHPSSTSFSPRTITTLTLRHTLTGDITTLDYDVVVLGTGYDRQAWRDLVLKVSSGSGSSHSTSPADFFRSRSRRASPTGSRKDSVDVSALRALNLDRDDGGRARSIAPSETTSRSNASLSPAPERLADSTTATSTPATSPPVSGAASPRGGDKVSGTGSDDGFGLGLYDEEDSTVEAWSVSRRYKLEIKEELEGQGEQVAVAKGKFRPGIWLQGCNEATHGISDTLLSVVGLRGGEIVDDVVEKGHFA